MDCLAGPGQQHIDFERFSRMVRKVATRSLVYSEDMAMVLRCVFNSYDKNKSGMLEKDECFDAVVDFGGVGRASWDAKRVNKLIAACHQDGQNKPLSFEGFLTLLRLLKDE